jgi:hypothetical protein
MFQKINQKINQKMRSKATTHFKVIFNFKKRSKNVQNKALQKFHKKSVKNFCQKRCRVGQRLKFLTCFLRKKNTATNNPKATEK